MIALLGIGTVTTAFVFASFGLVGGGLFCYAILFCPPDDVLVSQVRKQELEMRQARRNIDEIESELKEVTRNLRSFRSKQESVVTSCQYKIETLLEQDWRSLQGVPWEDYLEEVCQTLGYFVETTPRSGDQGVDLVLQKGMKRIAVQAKGYTGNVDNKAVQQVVAGMKVYGCSVCVVITNSRFAPSARTLADANGCVLIDEVNFPDFARGDVYL